MKPNYEYGLPYLSYKITRNKKMEILLTEDDLKRAVKNYLTPRMKYHDIENIYVRNVKVDQEPKRMEIVATLKEKAKHDGKFN